MRFPRKKKKSVDPEQAQDLASIRAAAVGLLARRDFASGELQSKLEDSGYAREVVAQAVAELVDGGVLNDARFAENFIAYHADRGQGPIRITADLRALGVPAELIVEALESGPSWPAIAREVRIRKFGLERPSTWPEKGRQARFLQYRGFSSDHIRAALGADFDPDEPS